MGGVLASPIHALKDIAKLVAFRLPLQEKDIQMDIYASIYKSDIFDEVAKTTAYVGKKAETEGAYERIYATEEDQELLDRYFDEATSMASEALADHLYSVANSSAYGGGVKYTFRVSDLADSTDIEDALRSFYVHAVCGKWLSMIDKAEAELYAKESVADLSEISRKLYHKKRPASVYSL